MAYANRSQTRVFSLCKQLSPCSRDSQSVTDYLYTIRTLTDELATAESPVSNEELIVKILSGLGSDFREISAVIRARDSSISYEELYEKPVDHEIFLQYESSKKILIVTAAVAQKNNFQPHRRNHNHVATTSRSPQNRTWHPQGSNSASPHTTTVQSSSRPWQQISNIAPGSVQTPICCQLCNRFGHMANVCRSRSHNHYQAKAHFMSSLASATPWIVDSGASHHITGDTSVFTSSQEYHGSEDISVGNGNTIPISRTGTAVLHTLTHSFKLNTLCVLLLLKQI